jgi:DNA mismatch repair protein MutS2
MSMLYPDTIEAKLGFDRIRSLVKSECSGPLGAQYVDGAKFSSDIHLLQKLHIQTKEFIAILKAGEPFPGAHFLDMYSSLQKAGIIGSYLLEDEFHQLQLSLKTLSACLNFISKRAELYPELQQLCGETLKPEAIIKAIERVLDETGKVKSNASPELSKVRSNMSAAQSRVRKVLESVLRDARGKGYAPDDANFTIRGGRMVIPVLAEHKRHIKGFVHDESASGQTVFLEPAPVLELNNEIRELELQERKEIVRILSALTDFLRPSISSLKQAYRVLGLLDFIRAKAKWAIKTESISPKIDKSPGLNWKNAYHPLLYLAHKVQNKPVIPQDIYLSAQHRILLISGPNAGGKSVTLKTVGLLQYMIQCGFPVPIDGESVAGIFKSIFIDIGDEQSIENDLSTYSSHLYNMRKFLEFADKRSLFLIDEFGTGTDPEFGGAIAEAILERLNFNGAYGVLTTHYSNLKEFASKNEGLINAAMQYDVDNLEPLYKLAIGQPGSSFALEIAAKIGLPQVVVDGARSKIGKDKVRMDKILFRLEREKTEWEKKNKEISQKQESLTADLEKYKLLNAYLESEKKAIIRQAKDEASQLLTEANRRIEATIRAIKEAEGEKEKTKEIRNELKEFVEQVKPKKEKVVQKIVKADSSPLKVGDYVEITDSGAFAQIESMRGDQAEILIGQIKSKVKLNRLRRAYRKDLEEPKKAFTVPKSGNIDMVETRANFTESLDLRGKRGEEAMPELEKFMDRALLLGSRELRIIHGKGDGILRTLVRNQLKRMPFVLAAKDDHPDFGGAGVTIVELK